MTTLEMEVALIQYFDVRRNLIVPNVSFGMSSKEYGSLHECDLLLLSKSGYATEIEIKISKQDLLKDKEKRHGHNHNLITNLYFAVPENLKDIAIDNIPYHAGLVTVSKNHNRFSKNNPYRVMIIKDCIRRKNSIKWDEKKKNELNEVRLYENFYTEKERFKT